MDIRITLMMALLGLFALWLLWRTGLLKSRLAVLNAAVLTALALVIRAAMLNYETLDYQDFLSRWVQFFRDNGGFLALRYEIGNYNIPYLYFLAAFSYSEIYDLYLIKLLSVFFDIVLAWAACRLVGHFGHSAAAQLGCFFAVLFLPTVYLNGAVWAQCDSSYAALALLGIYLALEDRPCLAMVCAALAFGFKLQAVFILPVYAVLWMKGRFKLWHFAIFPAAYILLVLPAVLLGRPFMDTLLLYFNQTGSIGDGLNYNSPSVYSFFEYVLPERYDVFAANAGIAAAFIFMLGLLAVCYVNCSRLSDRALLIVGLLFALGIPFLLPHMHERYFFCADVLALVLAFVLPELSCLPFLTQFASLLGYYAYLTMRYLLLMNRGAAALAAAIILCFGAFARVLIKKDENSGLTKENNLL